MFQRQHMRFAEIAHMNIIADRGAVRSRILVPKHRYVRLPTERGKQDVRNKVGFRFVMLSTPQCRAGSVEVSERHIFQPVGPIVCSENLFHDEFGPAVRICRLLWMFLIDGNAHWLAISRARRREDYSAHTSSEQYIEEGDPVRDVFLKVEFGLGY